MILIIFGAFSGLEVQIELAGSRPNSRRLCEFCGKGGWSLKILLISEHMVISAS